MTFKYNEDAIKLYSGYGEAYFSNYLGNKSNNGPDVLYNTNNIETIKQRESLENYILSEFNNASSSKKDAMRDFVRGFYNEFLKKPDAQLDSGFLQSPNAVKELCGQSSEGIQLAKQVINTYKENIANIQQLYLRDKTTGILTEAETNRLMYSLTQNVGTTNLELGKAQDEYIKRLLSQNKKPNELLPSQLKFIVTYVNDKMAESKAKEQGISKDKLKAKVCVGVDEKKLGGFQYRNLIYLNKDSMITKTLEEIFQVTCHETQHISQYAKSQEGDKGLSGLDYSISRTMREYYRENHPEFDIYDKNYIKEKSEEEAEYIGTKYAATLLTSLGFKGKSDNIVEAWKARRDRRKLSYDFRQDENKVINSREKFFQLKLNQIVKERPDFLTKYPSLLVLFEKDGSPKQFEEILSSEFKVNESEKSESLEDFCKAKIYDGALKTIDLNQLPEKDQVRTASRLINILSGEGLTLGGMNGNESIYPIENLDKAIKESLEEFHLKTSITIIKFLNKNCEQLLSLQEQGKFESIIDMDSYFSTLGMFASDGIYKNLKLKDSRYVEQVKGAAQEGREKKEQIKGSKNSGIQMVDVKRKVYGVRMPEIDKQAKELISLRESELGIDSQDKDSQEGR